MNHDDRLKVANILKKLEGFRSKPYPDNGHSVGYGHHLETKEDWAAYGKGITEPQAHDLLIKDIQIVESALPNYIKVPISSRQEAALVLWGFNFGYPKLSKATFVKKINQGIKDRNDIAKGDGTNGWEAWNTFKKKYNETLHQRRIMEVAIFFGDSKIPLPKSAGGGTMDWAEGADVPQSRNINDALLPDIPNIPDLSGGKILPYILGGLGLLALLGGAAYYFKS